MSSFSLFFELGIYDRVYVYCFYNYSSGDGYMELEQIIATDSSSSYWYAKSVMRSRFKLGEGVIATNEIMWDWYREFLESL